MMEKICTKGDVSMAGLDLGTMMELQDELQE